MAEVKKRFYRLFKVAKELNVASDTLVEHLKNEGHDVVHSPNTKLPPDMYELLLKKFASDKSAKEKAEQFIESRKEENKVVTKSPEEEAKSEENEANQLTASDLRNTITAKPSRKKKIVITDEPTKDVPPPPPVEKVEQPVAKKEDDTVKKAEVKPEDAPNLKVVGKIDLDSLNKSKKKTPTKKEEPVVEDKEPVVDEPKAEEPVEKAPEKEEVVEAKKEEAIETEVPQVKEKQVEPKEEEGQEEGEIIRAGDRAPKLSGLKVMGKIELEKPERPKKKSKQEETSSNGKAAGQKSSGEDSEDDEGGAKKRRRRRKRKRKSSEGSGSSNQGNNQGRKTGGEGRKKKEKPSQKEVDASIRNTLSQMNQGASRRRQHLRRARRDAEAAKRELEMQERFEAEKVLELTEFITANDFANMLSVPVNEVIKKAFELGMMVSINQRLDAELLSIIAEEYGFEVNFVDASENEFEIIDVEDAEEDLVTRNPIITVMGHVDHGKTTLLDFLRETNVTSQEAGGITQHIGAYEATLSSGRKVTFLDTPGHEAFTAMRARGAKATDVVIVVIAADDAIMPQTREAINHAQAAEVPMIFAINKIDKAGADPEKIKGQLAEMNLLVEDWGGKFQSQEISALKGTNVDELLEKVILEADLLELKANPDRVATGTVIEARLDKGRGNVVTMLVQKGTLRVGDEMVAGVHYGKVRALINQNGERIDEAGPSTPIQVLGVNGQPQAGDKFQVFDEDGKAKELASKRLEVFREQQLRQTKRITLEEIGRRRAIGNFEELNVIIKGDVDGSVEALSGSLLKLSTEEVQVNILTKSVGAITEGDVLLASASDAFILAFNVRPTSKARVLAENEQIEIRTYSVIYDAINDVKDALEGLLSPELKEEALGTAEVREVFKVSKVGTVAGSYVTSGKIFKNEPVRVIREGVVIYNSKLSSLKRFKDDVKEVLSGYECGIMVENYNDVKVGDTIECYKVNEIKRKLA